MISFVFLIVAKRTIMKLLWILVIALMLTGVLVTVARSGMIALAVASIFFALHSRSMRRYAVVVLVAALVLIPLVMGGTLFETVYYRMEERFFATDIERVIPTRLIIWNASKTSAGETFFGMKTRWSPS